jgi:hypothetical protein
MSRIDVPAVSDRGIRSKEARASPPVTTR